MPLNQTDIQTIQAMITQALSGAPSGGGGITHREIKRIESKIRALQREVVQSSDTLIVDRVFEEELTQVALNGLADGTTVLLTAQPTGAALVDGVFVVVSGAPNNTLQPLEINVGSIIFPLDEGLPFIVTDVDPFTSAQLSTQGSIFVDFAVFNDIDPAATGAAAETAVNDQVGGTVAVGDLIFVTGQGVFADNGFYAVGALGANFFLIRVDDKVRFDGTQVTVRAGLYRGLEFSISNDQFVVDRLTANLNVNVGVVDFAAAAGPIPIAFLGTANPADLNDVGAKVLTGQNGALLNLALRSDATTGNFAAANGVTIQIDRDGGVVETFGLGAADLPAVNLVEDSVMNIELVTAFIAAGLDTSDLLINDGDEVSIQLTFAGAETAVIRASLGFSAIPIRGI